MKIVYSSRAKIDLSKLVGIRFWDQSDNFYCTVRAKIKGQELYIVDLPVKLHRKDMAILKERYFGEPVRYFELEWGSFAANGREVIINKDWFCEVYINTVNR